MLLSKLSEFISKTIGLHFPEDRYADMQRGIEKSAEDFGFEDSNKFIKWILSTPLTENQIKKISANLTIGETYFFRDSRGFEILRDHILPEILDNSSRRQIKIWSAGCSTGEEPYSIAIWLDSLKKDLDIKIIASDLNINSLDKAEKGIYTEWSFRGTPNWVKTNYFKTTGKNQYILDEKIKNMVEFFYLNLVEDKYPSILNNTDSINVIFCRNVMMYFDKDTYKKVVHKFYKSLKDSGYLIVSAVETSQEMYNEFKILNLSGLSVYKKTDENQQNEITYNYGSNYNYAQYIEQDNLETEPITEYSYITEPIHQEIIGDEFTDSEDYEDEYQQAVQQYTLKNYNEAENQLLKIYSHPDIKNFSHLSNIISMLINIYASNRMFEKAEEWCHIGINTDKTEPKFHYFLANIFQEQEKIPEAITSLKKVLYLEPDFIISHFMLGNLNKQLDKIDEAKKHFKIALDLLLKMEDNDIVPESGDTSVSQMKSVIKMQLNNEE